MNLLQKYDDIIAKRIICDLEDLGTPDPEVIDLYPISELGMDTDIEDTDVDNSDLEVYIPEDAVSIYDKEESMDALHSRICNCNPQCKCADNPCTVECPEDGGYTKGHVQHFLDTYQEGDTIIQILRKDLISLLSDIHWIKESGNEHEQFSLDFADALNEISIMI